MCKKLEDEGIFFTAMFKMVFLIESGDNSIVIFVSRKSPTGPTERTPKPEYLIARSQFAYGSVGIQSRSILDGLPKGLIPRFTQLNLLTSRVFFFAGRVTYAKRKSQWPTTNLSPKAWRVSTNDGDVSTTVRDRLVEGW